MHKLSSLVLAGFLMSSGLACRASRQTAQVASAEEDPWAKQAWMDKAAKTLLYGTAGLSPAEAAQLKGLAKEAIVDKLMEDPRFDDTALDFNMFFLGLKQSELKRPLLKGMTYRDEVFYAQTAAASARELAQGGDYFTLFDWKVPSVLAGPPTNPQSVSGQAFLDSPEKMRAYWLAKTKGSLDAWIAEIEGSHDNNTLCARYLNSGDEEEDYDDYLYKIGLPPTLTNAFDSKSIPNLLMCGALGDQVSPSPRLKQNILAEARTYREALAKIPRILASLPSKITGPADLIRVSPADLPVLKEQSLEAFSSDIWRGLTNSSTNYNRKRAAYVLKTFFCDDLTPLNVVAPAQHAENRHASEPACQACHYKLDPMAGFFRNRGIAGTNFETLGILVHDDQLKREGEDRTQYLASWKAPQGRSRVWDVGYIRSSKQETLNAYGETLDDLFKIIRAAPESKACLTKRMAEYFLGVGQVYDGRWLDSLAQEFKAAAQPAASPGDSSKAFKKVVKSLVLSRTFSTPDPVKGRCYDVAPNSPPSSLPCEVAFIIEKNCASCHGGQDSPKGLDLSLWKVMPGGKPGFVHMDEATSRQLAPAVSLARIACSLSPTDQCPEAKLMPLNREMDGVERATLYKWVQKELTGGAP